jgi:rhodanese-related sulfurtransferase
MRRFEIMLKIGIITGCALILCAVGIYVLSRLQGLAAETGTFRELNAQEFARLLEQADAVILDVRTPREFQSGYIKGAVNVDINGPDFDKKIAELDRNKTYLIYCASGARSARACGKMARMNFTKLVNLRGGIIAWRKAGMPLEK